MEEPENFVDHVHLIDCHPRQVGRANVVKELIAALEAQGKRVVVIGMDSPRPLLLGGTIDHYGNPDVNELLDHRTLVGGFGPIPFAGKSSLMSSLDRMFPPEESKDAMLDRFMTSMMMPSREWLDPIPEPIVKKDWREDRMAFLNGIGGKKKHQKR